MSRRRRARRLRLVERYRERQERILGVPNRGQQGVARRGGEKGNAPGVLVGSARKADIHTHTSSSSTNTLSSPHALSSPVLPPVLPPSLSLITELPLSLNMQETLSSHSRQPFHSDGGQVDTAGAGEGDGCSPETVSSERAPPAHLQGMAGLVRAVELYCLPALDRVNRAMKGERAIDRQESLRQQRHQHRHGLHQGQGRADHPAQANRGKRRAKAKAKDDEFEKENNKEKEKRLSRTERSQLIEAYRASFLHAVYTGR